MFQDQLFQVTFVEKKFVLNEVRRKKRKVRNVFAITFFKKRVKGQLTIGGNPIKKYVLKKLLPNRIR